MWKMKITNQCKLSSTVRKSRNAWDGIETSSVNYTHKLFQVMKFDFWFSACVIIQHPCDPRDIFVMQRKGWRVRCSMTIVRVLSIAISAADCSYLHYRCRNTALMGCCWMYSVSCTCAGQWTAHAQTMRRRTVIGRSHHRSDYLWI